MSNETVSRPESFLQVAIQLSLDSVAAGGGPFGAVVAREGVIVGRGSNQVTGRNDPTAHAEIVAIRDACSALETFQLSECELYTTCEPCPMCLGAVLWARLDRVWYGCTREEAAAAGFDDSAFYDEIAKSISARKIPMRQLLAEESRAAFEAWRTAPHKTRY